MFGGPGKFLKRPWGRQRVELYVSGVDVPKLGSLKDFLLRDYLVKQARKEVHKNQLMMYAALAMTAGLKDPKKIQSAIHDSWNEYLNLELFMEGTREQQELDMREEYAYWKNIRPKINIGKDGVIKVSGIKLEDARRSKPPSPRR